MHHRFDPIFNFGSRGSDLRLPSCETVQATHCAICHNDKKDFHCGDQHCGVQTLDYSSSDHRHCNCVLFGMLRVLFRDFLEQIKHKKQIRDYSDRNDT